MAAAFEVVKIDLSGAGSALLKSATASKIIRLHELVLGLAANGTVTVEETSGDDLSGDIPVAANWPLVIPFREQREACLKTATGHGMQVTVTGGAAAGYAVISSDTN